MVKIPRGISIRSMMRGGWAFGIPLGSKGVFLAVSVIDLIFYLVGVAQKTNLSAQFEIISRESQRFGLIVINQDPSVPICFIIGWLF